MEEPSVDTIISLAKLHMLGDVQGASRKNDFILGEKSLP